MPEFKFPEPVENLDPQKASPTPVIPTPAPVSNPDGSPAPSPAPPLDKETARLERTETAEAMKNSLELDASVAEVVERISDAISPAYAKALLAARQPVTPDPVDLARVMLHLARDYATVNRLSIATHKLS